MTTAPVVNRREFLRTGAAGGAVDGFADALVSATAANVAAHEIVDVGVSGIWFFGEERGGRHDLTALAIAALGHVNFDPGLLDGMIAFLGETFDGGDFLAGDGGNRRDAGTGGFSVDVNGTSSAERHAAAELGAGHVQGVAQDPEQGHLGINVYGLGFSVEGERDGHRTSHEERKLQNTSYTGRLFTKSRIEPLYLAIVLSRPGGIRDEQPQG